MGDENEHETNDGIHVYTQSVCARFTYNGASTII